MDSAGVPADAAAMVPPGCHVVTRDDFPYPLVLDTATGRVMGCMAAPGTLLPAFPPDLLPAGATAAAPSLLGSPYEAGAPADRAVNPLWSGARRPQPAGPGIYMPSPVGSPAGPYEGGRLPPLPPLPPPHPEGPYRHPVALRVPSSLPLPGSNHSSPSGGAALLHRPRTRSGGSVHSEARPSSPQHFQQQQQQQQHYLVAPPPPLPLGVLVPTPLRTPPRDPAASMSLLGSAGGASPLHAARLRSVVVTLEPGPAGGHGAAVRLETDVEGPAQALAGHLRLYRVRAPRHLLDTRSVPVSLEAAAASIAAGVAQAAPAAAPGAAAASSMADAWRVCDAVFGRHVYEWEVAPTEPQHDSPSDARARRTLSLRLPVTDLRRRDSGGGRGDDFASLAAGQSYDMAVVMLTRIAVHTAGPPLPPPPPPPPAAAAGVTTGGGSVAAAPGGHPPVVTPEDSAASSPASAAAPSPIAFVYTPVVAGMVSMATPPALPSPPASAPTQGKISNGKTGIRVKWPAPGPHEDGGAAVVSYELQATQLPSAADAEGSSATAAADEQWEWATIYCGSDTTADHKRLRPGRAYAFRYRVATEAGTCPGWSPVAILTTDNAVPAPPAPVTCATAGPTHLLLQWAAPAEDNGSEAGEYRLEVAVGAPSSEYVAAMAAAEAAAPHVGVDDAAAGGAAGAAGEPKLPRHGLDFSPLFCGSERGLLVRGLLTGTVLTFRVSARNAVGFSLPSGLTTLVVPAAVPLAPAGLRLTQLAPPSPASGSAGSAPAAAAAGDGPSFPCTRDALVQLQWERAVVPGASESAAAAAVPVPSIAGLPSAALPGALADAVAAQLSSSRPPAQPGNEAAVGYRLEVAAALYEPRDDSARRAAEEAASKPAGGSGARKRGGRHGAAGGRAEAAPSPAGSSSSSSDVFTDGTATPLPHGCVRLLTSPVTVEVGASVACAYSLGRLTPGGLYVTRLRAYNAQGVSPPTAWYVFKTGSSQPAPITTARCTLVEAPNPAAMRGAPLPGQPFPPEVVPPHEQYALRHGVAVTLAVPAHHGEPISRYVLELRHHPDQVPLAPWAGLPAHASNAVGIAVPRRGAPAHPPLPPALVGDGGGASSSSSAESTLLPLILQQPTFPTIEKLSCVLSGEAPPASALPGDAGDDEAGHLAGGMASPTPSASSTAVASGTGIGGNTLRSLRVGDEVDALYAGDGRWYPSTVTSVVPVPRQQQGLDDEPSAHSAYDDDGACALEVGGSITEFGVEFNYLLSPDQLDMTFGMQVRRRFQPGMPVSALIDDRRQMHATVLYPTDNGYCVSITAITLASACNPAAIPDVPLTLPSADVTPLTSIEHAEDLIAEAKSEMMRLLSLAELHKRRSMQWLSAAKAAPAKAAPTSPLGAGGDRGATAVPAAVDAAAAAAPTTAASQPIVATAPAAAASDGRVGHPPTARPARHQKLQQPPSAPAAFVQLAALHDGAWHEVASLLASAAGPAMVDRQLACTSITLPAVSGVLLPGHTYSLRVAAVNDCGRGDWSPEMLVVAPRGPPATPPVVVVSVDPLALGGGGGGGIELRLSTPQLEAVATASSVVGPAAADDLGILPSDELSAAVVGWLVEAAPADVLPAFDDGSGPPVHLSFDSKRRVHSGVLPRRGGCWRVAARGLEPGRAFTFRAAMVTLHGVSPWSPLTVGYAPARQPSEPAAVSAQLADGSSALAALCGALPAVATVVAAVGPQLPAAVAAALSSSYAGSSVSPPASRVVAVVSWAPPSADNGASIEAYELAVASSPHNPPVGLLALAPSSPTGLALAPYEPSPDTGGGGEAGGGAPLQLYRGPAPLAVVGALQPGRSYAFVVRAINSQGAGPWSAPMSLQTPHDVPPPVASLPVALATGQASLRIGFARAASVGGNTALSYDVQRVRLDASTLGEAAFAVLSSLVLDCGYELATLDAPLSCSHSQQLGEYVATSAELGACAAPARFAGGVSSGTAASAVTVVNTPASTALSQAAYNDAVAAAGGGDEGSRGARPSASVPAGAAGMRLAHLAPSALWAVRVRATSVAGTGEFGPWVVLATTSAAAAQSPLAVAREAPDAEVGPRGGASGAAAMAARNGEGDAEGAVGMDAGTEGEHDDDSSSQARHSHGPPTAGSGAAARSLPAPPPQQLPRALRKRAAAGGGAAKASQAPAVILTAAQARALQTAAAAARPTAATAAGAAAPAPAPLAVEGAGEVVRGTKAIARQLANRNAERVPRLTLFARKLGCDTHTAKTMLLPAAIAIAAVCFFVFLGLAKPA